MIPSPLVRALALGTFTGLASLALAYSSQTTAPLIAEQEQNDRRVMLAQVIPPERSDVPVDRNVRRIEVEGATRDYFLAEKEGKVTAVAFQSQAPGYSGIISVLIGVEPNGTILGVRVTSHTETPGLGDKIEAAKSNWIHGFDGKGLGNPPEAQWLVKKDGGAFDALSGATITPRAVVLSVREGLTRYATVKDKLVSAVGHATETDTSETPPQRAAGPSQTATP